MESRLLVAAMLIVLIGCASGKQASAPVAPPRDYDAALKSWHDSRLAEGKAIYQRECAACHDPGTSDAPAIGLRQDWDHRSRLWAAVLFEHARQGYLGMPPRGGVASLSDQEVDAAAEYMLTVTYPELPAD